MSAFFIDYVDYDLNMRLMRAHYRIARAKQTYLLHRVGEARDLATHPKKVARWALVLGDVLFVPS